MVISYTKIHTYMECEYAYYLRYIKRIPIAETPASVYGKAIHKAIKVGYESQLPKEDWPRVFKRIWAEEVDKSGVAFSHDREFLGKQNNGVKSLNEYYKTFVYNKPAPKLIECRFGSNEHVKIGNHEVHGAIDQVDSKDRVIDYKTGAAYTRFYISVDLQLTIYSYVYRQLFNSKEKALVIRNLNTMKDVSTTRDEADYELLLNELDKIEYKTKKKNEFSFARNIGKHCARCYFLKECLGIESKGGW